MALLAPVVLIGMASAQDPDEPDEASIRAKMDIVLRESDRVRHGDGSSPQIVGVEQGDNEIRSQTPALENSARTQSRHDSNDQHQRALAMYESRARFSSPAQIESGLPEDDPTAEPTIDAKALPVEESAAADHGDMRWLGGLLVALGALIVGVGWLRSKD